MGITEDIADKLAQDVIRQMEQTGDEDLAKDIAKTLGTSSATTEEAFNTAMRVRLAETRARRLMVKRESEIQDGE